MISKVDSIRLKLISVIIFGFFIGYWIIFQLFLAGQEGHHHQVYTFSTLYGLMALWGAYCGFSISQNWGGIKSVLGKALIMFSIGLLLQEFGQLMYSYYYIIKQLAIADYPGLGDLGFFGTIPFYCLGVIYIARASGVGLRLKSLKNLVLPFLITFGVLASGYYLFLQEYIFEWSNPLKVFLDFGYPLGAAVYISLAISTYFLSKGVLGGVMKNKILFIILALLVQFLAEYTFLYQTSRGTWTDSGTNDLIYLISYFMMTLSLINFNSVYENLKKD